MGLINMLFGEKRKYRSPKELGIYPSQLRFKIYELFREGKTAVQIYDELKEEEGWVNHQRSLRLNYIEYFHRKMKGEVP